MSRNAKRVWAESVLRVIMVGPVYRPVIPVPVATTGLTAHPMHAPWIAVDWDADPTALDSAANDSPQELYRLWRDAAARCRAAVAEVVADGGLDRPVRFTIDPSELPNARRLLVDLHDEYARHVGHADLFREAVDGLVGEDPPQQ